MASSNSLSMNDVYNYVLIFYVNNDNKELYEKYASAVDNHNESLIRNLYPDSGFDLYAFTIMKTAATPAYHIIGNALGVA